MVESFIPGVRRVENYFYFMNERFRENFSFLSFKNKNKLYSFPPIKTLLQFSSYIKYCKETTKDNF